MFHAPSAKDSSGRKIKPPEKNFTVVDNTKNYPLKRRFNLIIRECQGKNEHSFIFPKSTGNKYLLFN